MSLETPVTLIDFLKRATDFLLARGIENPRLNAERLLCSVLGCQRIDLYVNFERVLSQGEVSRYRDLISRRGKREPLQYILGTAAFFGRDFAVTPSVLIPRPETELLVEQVISRSSGKRNPRVADIGTGSGCIAVTLALEIPAAEVVASDISAHALVVARRNAEAHNVTNRVDFVQGDLGSPFGQGVFDIVVANLPYVALSESPELQPEVVDHEPYQALFAGNIGTELIAQIISDAPRFLAEGGVLALELGKGQSTAVEQLFGGFGDGVHVEILSDHAGMDRIAITTFHWTPGNRISGDPFGREVRPQ